MPQVASMGAAVSVVDFDRDGWSDIYVTNSGEGSKNALFKNMTDGSFKDVARGSGIADLNQVGTGVSMGAVWGDYDNDGYEDLFLYKWGKPGTLSQRRGTKVFARHRQSGCPRGSTPTPRSGLTTIAMDGSISFSAAITPKTSISGI